MTVDAQYLLTKYYAQHQRVHYDNKLWDRMVATLDHSSRLQLLPFKYSCGHYVNVAGEKIESRYAELSPQLAITSNPLLQRYQENELLRRIIKTEMIHCPVDGIPCTTVLNALLSGAGKNNRLVQSVYSLVEHCGRS